MKIAVPTNNKMGLGDKVAEHFGRCFTYTFLDQKGQVLEIIDNTSQHTQGAGLPPDLIKKHGADILLCKELGQRAIALCNKLGIKVYLSQAEKVKTIFDSWKSGKTKKAKINNACQHNI